MSDHLDLDALADLVDAPAPDEHLAACAECAGRLDGLHAAQARVTAALAALSDPPLPDGLADRLTAQLGRAGDGDISASVTTLPERNDATKRRWLLPAAAAAVLLLALGGYATQRGGRPGVSTSASGSAASAPRAAAPTITNNSGADYSGQQALAAAVPQLLAGKANGRVAAAAPAAPTASASAPVVPAPAAGTGSAPAEDLSSQQVAPADPLAPLRTGPGLAGCLQALLPPNDPSAAPLAIDYGSFRGTPALVVVLPSSIAGKLDVFVVGADCAPSHDSTLFYASVPRR